MMKATPNGVRPAPDAERRYTITCIHNADKMFDKPKLVKKLSTKSLEELHELLSKPDIQLTTAKDKDTMLPKVLETNERVKDMFKHTTGRRQVDLSQSFPRQSSSGTLRQRWLSMRTSRSMATASRKRSTTSTWTFPDSSS